MMRRGRSACVSSIFVQFYCLNDTCNVLSCDVDFMFYFLPSVPSLNYIEKGLAKLNLLIVQNPDEWIRNIRETQYATVKSIKQLG